MIGVFDSGIGGLGVLRIIRELDDSVDIVYFGDTKYAPYGNKSADERIALATHSVEQLRLLGATHVVVACNSLSVLVTPTQRFGLPPSGYTTMIEPACADAAHALAGKRVLVLATNATVSSGAYQRGLTTASAVLAVGLSHLAEYIERGAPESILVAELQYALASAAVFRPDVIFLGCTHYPFVTTLIKRVFCRVHPRIRLYDPASAVARAALRSVGSVSGTGQLQIYFSAPVNQSLLEGYVPELPQLLPFPALLQTLSPSMIRPSSISPVLG